MKKYRLKYILWLLIALSFSLTSCQEEVPPNVVFVFADQWRAQDIGFAGNTQVHTPALDQLATESVVFSNAISNIPVCGPARASLMTGKYPLSHGVFYNDKPLRNEDNSIANVYKKNGYQTAYIGKWHINGREKGQSVAESRDLPIPLERRQGFDYWKVRECTHNYNNSFYFDENNEKHTWKGYDAIAQTEDAINYIKENKENPFVLFLSWGPPHAPYHSAPKQFKDLYKDVDIKLRPNVPEEMANVTKATLKGYYAHISALDYCVSRLQEEIKTLGLDENTIFVFTSDHGDMLNSHAQTKKQKPWDESIKVPFILKYPKKLAGGVQLSKVFSYPDIMPTLLGLCGLDIPQTVEGLDYTKQLLGEEELLVDGAFITCPVPFHQWSYKMGGREFRGIRTERYTYVKDLNGPWLLYDNLEDPYQLNNLCNHSLHSVLQADLDAKLQVMLEQRHDAFLEGKEYMKNWKYTWDKDDSLKITDNIKK